MTDTALATRLVASVIVKYRDAFQHHVQGSHKNFNCVSSASGPVKPHDLAPSTLATYGLCVQELEFYLHVLRTGCAPAAMDESDAGAPTAGSNQSEGDDTMMQGQFAHNDPPAEAPHHPSGTQSGMHSETDLWVNELSVAHDMGHPPKDQAPLHQALTGTVQMGAQERLTGLATNAAGQDGLACMNSLPLWQPACATHGGMGLLQATSSGLEWPVEAAASLPSDAPQPTSLLGQHPTGVSGLANCSTAALINADPEACILMDLHGHDLHGTSMPAGMQADHDAHIPLIQGRNEDNVQQPAGGMEKSAGRWNKHDAAELHLAVALQRVRSVSEVVMQPGTPARAALPRHSLQVSRGPSTPSSPTAHYQGSMLGHPALPTDAETVGARSRSVGTFAALPPLAAKGHVTVQDHFNQQQQQQQQQSSGVHDQTSRLPGAAAARTRASSSVGPAQMQAAMAALYAACMRDADSITSSACTTPRVVHLHGSSHLHAQGGMNDEQSFEHQPHASDYLIHRESCADGTDSTAAVQSEPGEKRLHAPALTHGSRNHSLNASTSSVWDDGYQVRRERISQLDSQASNPPSVEDVNAVSALSRSFSAFPLSDNPLYRAAAAAAAASLTAEQLAAILSTFPLSHNPLFTSSRSRAASNTSAIGNIEECIPNGHGGSHTHNTVHASNGLGADSKSEVHEPGRCSTSGINNNELAPELSGPSFSTYPLTDNALFTVLSTVLSKDVSSQAATQQREVEHSHGTIHTHGSTHAQLGHPAAATAIQSSSPGGGLSAFRSNPLYSLLSAALSMEQWAELAEALRLEYGSETSRGTNMNCGSLPAGSYLQEDAHRHGQCADMEACALAEGGSGLTHGSLEGWASAVPPRGHMPCAAGSTLQGTEAVPNLVAVASQAGKGAACTHNRAHAQQAHAVACKTRAQPMTNAGKEYLQTQVCMQAAGCSTYAASSGPSLLQLCVNVTLGGQAMHAGHATTSAGTLCSACIQHSAAPAGRADKTTFLLRNGPSSLPEAPVHTGSSTQTYSVCSSCGKASHAVDVHVHLDLGKAIEGYLAQRALRIDGPAVGEVWQELGALRNILTTPPTPSSPDISSTTEAASEAGACLGETANAGSTGAAATARHRLRTAMLAARPMSDNGSAEQRVGHGDESAAGDATRSSSPSGAVYPWHLYSRYSSPGTGRISSVISAAPALRSAAASAHASPRQSAGGQANAHMPHCAT